MYIILDGVIYYIVGLIRSGSTVQWDDGSAWNISVYASEVQFNGGGGSETYFRVYYYADYLQAIAYSSVSHIICQLKPF